MLLRDYDITYQSSHLDLYFPIGMEPSHAEEPYAIFIISPVRLLNSVHEPCPPIPMQADFGPYARHRLVIDASHGNFLISPPTNWDND